MAKFNLIARRHIGEDWSAWCSTNDEDTVKRNIKVIESYGWMWSLEEPVYRHIFKTTCEARGIDKHRIAEYCKGRIKFTTEDIEILETRRWCE